MILVLSPSKSLNYDKQIITDKFTEIDFPEKTEKLVKKLKKFNPKEIGNLMSISAKLSDLNYERFQTFSNDFNNINSKQAIFAFTGDVYRGLDAENFNQEDLDFAQRHVRILSGLYGLIKPLDLTQPYRLEMGTSLEISAKEKNLYAFWKTEITKKLNEELKGDVLINLASNEYFKSIDTKQLKSKILIINFKENKGDKFKIVAIYAKVARGYMANYIVKNKIDSIEHLKGFDYDNYSFNEELSSEWEFVFTR
jgi:cytoplasmic iron level regulating protein YaaA (DUF328/UPF0246 family)